MLLPQQAADGHFPLGGEAAGRVVGGDLGERDVEDPARVSECLLAGDDWGAHAASVRMRRCRALMP